MSNLIDKFGKGKPDYRLVRGDYNDQLAAYIYVLYVWIALDNMWLTRASGNLEWAKKIAKHHKIEITK